MHTFEGIKYKEIEDRAFLANAENDFAHFEFLSPITDEKHRGFDPLYKDCVFIRPNNSSTMRGIPPLICVDENGLVSVIRTRKYKQFDDVSDVPLSNLENMKGKFVEENFLSGEGPLFAITVALDQDASSAAVEDDEEVSDGPGSMDWLEQELQSASADGVINGYAEVIFSRGGVTLASDFDDAVDSEEFAFDDAKSIMASIKKSLNRKAKTASSIDDLIETNPMAMYEILITFGVVSHVVMTDVELATSLGEALQVLASDLDIKDAPLLIETEDKASTTYGGIARNAALEVRLTNIEISANNTIFSFGVAESLTLAAVGS
jgi:hypothetical protein